MKFGFNLPLVSEEMFENGDTHTYIDTYIHTHRLQEAYLYYKLTYEPKPKGSGELKIYWYLIHNWASFLDI